MDVTQSPAAATAAAASKTASPTEGSQARAVISSDFETFLQMLTAQARYQDPLDPLDSSEYAAQLAQFSSVEQQVMTNDLLSAMVNQLGGSDMASVAGWIGMEARTSQPVHFNGTPIEVAPNPINGADEAFLVVRNAAGKEVQRLELPVTNTPYTWDGRNSDGDLMAKGVYTFDVESVSDDQILGTSRAETYARITEARVQEGQTVLILNGGAPVTTEAVTALREPA